MLSILKAVNKSAVGSVAQFAHDIFQTDETPDINRRFVLK